MAQRSRLSSASAIRRAAAVALLGVTAACGAAPIAPDDSPKLTVTKILAFGDSLTEGDATPSGFSPFFAHPTDDPGPAKGFPYKLLTLLNQRYTTQSIKVYNGGYGGRLASSDALDEPDRTLDDFLNAFSPNVMILMHGTNDINQPQPNVDAVAGLVGLLVSKAQARGVSVIVSGLPPRLSGGTPNRGNNPQLVVPYNQALAAMAAQKRVRYIDVYGLITQNLAGPDMAPDGLHLSQAGNDKLAAAYFGRLRQSYEISR